MSDPFEKNGVVVEGKVAEGCVLEDGARRNPDSGSLGLANVLEGSMACELKELIPKSSHLGGSTGSLVALDTGVRMAVPPESVQDNWHRDQDLHAKATRTFSIYL